MASATPMLQPRSQTFRGETRGKLVVTREGLYIYTYMSGIGNVFAHRLFTHLVRPPEEKKKKREEEERNWNRKEEKKRRIREKEKEKHRNTSGIVLGFHQKNVATSMETWQRTGGLGPLNPSRPFRGSSRQFGCSNLPTFCNVVTYNHQRMFPFVPTIQRYIGTKRTACHEETPKISFRHLSRSNFTFAIFHGPAFSCH